MPPKQISQGFAANLFQLLEGEVLNASAFCNRGLLEKMVEDRVLERAKTGRGRAKISCQNPAALRHYLRLQLGIADLAAYLDLLQHEERDGEESLQATTSTKTLRTRSLQGFFIKAFNVEPRVAGEELGRLPDGVEYFVRDPDSLSLSARAVVVGVENPECFTKAGRLLHLFPHEELVFVLRYHSNRLIQWLETVDNPYVHFGDFDPAGIAIYCNEYLSVLGVARCSFFVPDGIEELIERGDPALFDRQAHLWPPKAEIQQTALQELIKAISRHAKGYEQEKLLQR